MPPKKNFLSATAVREEVATWQIDDKVEVTFTSEDGSIKTIKGSVKSVADGFAVVKDTGDMQFPPDGDNICNVVVAHTPVVKVSFESRLSVSSKPLGGRMMEGHYTVADMKGLMMSKLKERTLYVFVQSGSSSFIPNIDQTLDNLWELFGVRAKDGRRLTILYALQEFQG